MVREGRLGTYCDNSRSAVMWHPGCRTVASRVGLDQPRTVHGKPDVRPSRLGGSQCASPLPPEGGGALRELPLRGYRVLEVDESTAIRFAGRLLADLGADVVMVEHDDADDQLAGYRLLNRGKRSIAASAFATHAEQILAGADVVLTSADSWVPSHQGQVVCGVPVLPAGASVSISGDEALCVDAYAGLLTTTLTFDGAPGLLEQPEGVFAAGAFAALGCSSALLVRERTGAGQRVSVSWLAGALGVQMFNLIANADVGMTSGWRGDPRGWRASFRLFRTSDGSWIYVACPNPAFWSRFCMAIDRMDLALDPRFENTPWQLDEGDEVDLTRELEAHFLTRRAAEWIERLETYDCIVGPVLTRQEWLRHPQVAANALAERVADPVLGEVVTAGTCFSFVGAPRAITAAPLAGTLPAAELMGEWPAHIAGACVPAPGGPPLGGFRVLDLGNYAAGPLVSRLLADLGADVIKVEPYPGDPFRGLGLAFAIVNRGKRSLGLDLRRHDPASVVLRRLVEASDAIVTNWRPKILADLHGDRESVHAVSDRVVYASISGYGSHGPWKNKPCVDLAVQAVTGWATSQGPSPDEPEAPGPWPFDNASPLLVAVGVVAGLVARERGERRIALDTSMVACAMTMQVDKYAVRPELSQVSDLVPREIRCANVATRDGWLTVAASATDGLVAASQPSSEVFAALSAAGTPSAIVQDRWTVMNDAEVRNAGLITIIPHAELGPLLQLGKVIQLSASNYELRTNYADIDSDGTSILADLGVSAEEIDRLLVEHIVRSGS